MSFNEPPAEEPQQARGKKAFGLNVVWNTLNFFLGYLLAIVTSIVIARGLGPSRAAIVSYVTWLTDTGGMLGGLGYIRGIERFVAQELGAGNNSNVTFIIRRSIAGVAGLSTLVAVVATGIGFYQLNNQDAWHPAYFPIIFSLILLNGIWLGTQAGSRGLYNFGSIAKSAIVRGILTLLIWWWMVESGLPLYSLFAVSAFLSVWACWTVLKSSGLIAWMRKPYENNWELWGKIRKYVLQVSPIIVADTIVLQRTELLFLAHYSIKPHIAFYNYAAALSMLVARIPLSFTAVLFPIFARRIGEGKGDEARSLYGFSSKWVLAVSLPIGLAAAALSKPLVITLFGQAFAPAAELLPILVIASILVPLGGPAASYLHSTDNQLFLMKLAPFTISINLLLDLVLISRYDMVGAAWANMLSQVVAVSAVLLYVQLKLGLRLPWLDLGKICICATLYYFFCVYLSQFRILGLLFGAMAITLYFGLLFASGVFREEISWLKRKVG